MIENTGYFRSTFNILNNKISILPLLSIDLNTNIFLLSFSPLQSRYSGGSMNPARSFAPAVIFSNFDYQWIYWVSPLSSALITSYIYKYFFKTQEPVITNATDDQDKVEI